MTFSVFFGLQLMAFFCLAETPTHSFWLPYQLGSPGQCLLACYFCMLSFLIDNRFYLDVTHKMHCCYTLIIISEQFSDYYTYTWKHSLGKSSTSWLYNSLILYLIHSKQPPNERVISVVSFCVKRIGICDPFSENPHSSHNFQFFFIFSALSTVFKEWVFKISAESGQQF